MRIYICFVFTLLSFTAFSQQYDNNWLFGYESDLTQDGVEGVVLNFDSNLVNVKSETLGTSISWSAAVISDKVGNLLFYTDGCRILGANHQIVENGEGINPGEVHNLQCDGNIDDYGYTAGKGSSIIIPSPYNDSLYFLLHKHIIYDYEPEFDVITDGLYYTLIASYANEGEGVVLEKNIPIIEENLTYGQLAATKHANGIDWWILTAGHENNKYYSILIDSVGITVDTSYNIGENMEDGGESSFSPDGKKYTRYNSLSGLYLFDFDRSTGMLSNFRIFDIINESLSDGVAFSPNSRFLYASAHDTIFQYDTDAINIENSREVVAIFNGFQDLFDVNFFTAQLAPDCKIYVNTFAAVHYLHVIHNPDKKGVACDVEQQAIELPYRHFRTIPYFPNYRLGPLIEGETPAPPCEAIVQTEEVSTPIYTFDAHLFPNPASSYLKVATLQSIPQKGALLLYTQLGQEVFQELLLKGEKEFYFEIDHLPVGLYFYTVAVGGRQVKAGKVVIAR